MDSETPYNDGEPLRALTTTLIRKLLRGSRLITVLDSNNVRDWAIRG